jgi:signal transduction histidine kinase
MKIRDRLVMLFSSLVILNLLTVVISEVSLSLVSNNGPVLSIGGQEQALVFKLTYLASVYRSQISPSDRLTTRKQIKDSLNQFENSLKTLHQGSDQLGLKPMTKPRVLVQLQKVETSWVVYRQYFDHILQDTPDQYAGDISYINTLTLFITNELDTLIELMHREAADLVEQTQQILLSILGLSLLIMPLAYFSVSRIVYSLTQVTQTAQRLSQGDWEVKTLVNTHDEVGILSNTFNQMVRQIKASRQSLLDYSHTLEEKTQELEQILTQLTSTQAQLVQTEKMSSLGQLVAGIAHEINNPVNFIYGNLPHLEDYVQSLIRVMQLYQEYYPQPVPEIQTEVEENDLEFLQADLLKIMDSMKIGTSRIRQIILSLRNFSRLDEADFKWVDIHEGIDNTLMILAHRLKERENYPAINLVKEYSQLPLVECTAGEINQVFMNVLVNAIDAIEEHNALRTVQEIKQNPSQITIRTSVLDAEWVMIAIADNALGIPQQVQKDIFNPFFTTKPVGKGTGLGMSISYKIITDKHGGKLECVSTPGKGAEFLIKIPIRRH